MPLGSDRHPDRTRIEGLMGRREKCSVPYAPKRAKTIPFYFDSTVYILICLNGDWGFHSFEHKEGEEECHCIPAN